MQQIILREREGGYIAEVPAYPACTSQGTTAREALNNVMKAMTLYHLSTASTKPSIETKHSSGLRARSTAHMR